MIPREMKIRAAFRFAPSQWEMPLLCNDVSHWLGASLKLALKIIISFIYSDSDYLKIAHEKWWTSKHGSFLKYHFGQTGTRLVGYFWLRYQGIWVTSQFKCHFLLTTIHHNLHKLQNLSRSWQPSNILTLETCKSLINIHDVRPFVWNDILRTLISNPTESKICEGNMKFFTRCFESYHIRSVSLNQIHFTSPKLVP